MVSNIIIVNDFAFINGGAGSVAIRTACELSRRGKRVFFFAGVAPVDACLEATGVKVFCLNQYDILNNSNRLEAIIQGLWNQKAYREFDKLLSSLDLQKTIIHFHSWTKVLSASLFAVTRKHHAKIVVTMHDYFSFCPNGGFFVYPQRSICERNPLSWRCVLRNCDARSFSQKMWRVCRQKIQNFYFWKNDIHFISISALTHELCLCHMPKKKIYPVARLNNPLELSDTKCELKKDAAYLFMGRLSSEKGLDLFCKAMVDLHLKGLVVGDGYLKEKYQAEYPQIDFVGWASGEEKKKYILQSKCLLFPSFWYEGAPLTIIEMKSYGIPCIVPDRCAASEQIENGKTGFVFKTGDYDSFVTAIKRLEEIDLNEMQKNIINTFHLNDYSMESHIKGLIDIYGD